MEKCMNESLRQVGAILQNEANLQEDGTTPGLKAEEHEERKSKRRKEVGRGMWGRGMGKEGARRRQDSAKRSQFRSPAQTEEDQAKEWVAGE